MSQTQNDSGLWGVGIGLAKIQGDPQQILERFVSAYNSLRQFDSSIASKLMAAEIMAATSVDFTTLSSSLADLEQRLRKEANVPKEESIGIAATLLYGGSDSNSSFSRFQEFLSITESKEAAAVLAITTIATDWLTSKFHSYTAMFSDWGYSTSDDADLAAAYMAISPLAANDVQAKMNTIVDALKPDLEYPLVAAAIVTSMSTLDASEALDLVEKGVSILGFFAKNLGRSELMSLSVRMVHGVNNQLAKQLDPNSAMAKTPVQFTQSRLQIGQSVYGTGPYFFPGIWWWYFPLIIAHSTYHNNFITGGGYHGGHDHGVGGFA